MEKYINEYGRECYRNVSLDSPFSSNLFHRKHGHLEEDEGFALYTNLGGITVLDRLTGFGVYVRDTETGFRDMEGKFWLASGMYDVRESGAETFGDAVKWIKERANTCVPAT